jgi:hypothetical protein
MSGTNFGLEVVPLMQRAHIVANWPPIYIGKESDKHLGRRRRFEFAGIQNN